MNPIPSLSARGLTNGWFNAHIHYEGGGAFTGRIAPSEEHTHGFYELHIHLSGGGTLLVGDTSHSVSRGDVVVILPQERHTWEDTGTGGEYYRLCLEELPTASERLREELCRRAPVVLSEEERERLLELCHSLYRAGLEGELGDFRAAEALFGVLDLVCRGHRQAPPTVKLPDAFTEILDYIAVHFTESSCTVSALCERFYVSKSTLCRRFHRFFRTTPSEYIESRRLLEGRKRLLEGRSVQEACYSCGFSDCSYFILRFRRSFGVTPYRFQKEALEGRREEGRDL